MVLYYIKNNKRTHKDMQIYLITSNEKPWKTKKLIFMKKYRFAKYYSKL